MSMSLKCFFAATSAALRCSLVGHTFSNFLRGIVTAVEVASMEGSRRINPVTYRRLRLEELSDKNKEGSSNSS